MIVHVHVVDNIRDDCYENEEMLYICCGFGDKQVSNLPN